MKKEYECFIATPAHISIFDPALTRTVANEYICGCYPGGTGPDNDWPALGLSWDLGRISPGTSATAFGVLGYDDVLSVRFFGHPQVCCPLRRRLRFHLYLSKRVYSLLTGGRQIGPLRSCWTTLSRSTTLSCS